MLACQPKLNEIVPARVSSELSVNSPNLSETASFSKKSDAVGKKSEKTKCRYIEGQTVYDKISPVNEVVE